MRGRKPEPTALKLARGVKLRGQKAELKPATIALRPPTILDADARKKWRELAPKLEKLGVLTGNDSETLALLCQAWSMAQQSRRDIAQRGMVLDNGKRNPSLLTWRENVALFARLSALFGMNPSDRARIGVEPDIDDDELNELFGV